MARQPSKILSPAELKVVKTEAKNEINTHTAAVKAAEKAIAAAKKTLAAASKTIEATKAKADKQHVADLKAANKAFEATQKEQQKIIDNASKLGQKAEARLAAATPAAAPVTA